MANKFGLADIAAQVSTKKRTGLPPVEEWDPPLSGDLDLYIDSSGKWFHEGQVIHREALVRLFSSILKREQDGKYYLVTPVEKYAIEVEDAPFLAVDMNWISKKGEQQLELETSVGDRVLVDAEHPVWVIEVDGQPRPYVRVRANLNALISRSLFYQLVDMADEKKLEEDGVVQLSIRSSGEDFILGSF